MAFSLGVKRASVAGILTSDTDNFRSMYSRWELVSAQIYTLPCPAKAAALVVVVWKSKSETTSVSNYHKT